MIERIALDGHAAGGSDQAFEFVARCELGRFRTGVMINLFLYHRTVKVVGTKAQLNLCDARREHDPIRFDVIEIIEQQPGYGDVAQIGVARGLWNVRERSIVRMKRQRYKRHEAMRLVLQLAQLDEVIDALFLRYHVPVKHGGVEAQADFMRLPRDV